MDINLFSKGSLYWYYNPYTKKDDYGRIGVNQDFTTNRPVIIISENRDNFINLSNVTCVLCTTSPRRLGIVIDSYNYSRTKIIKTAVMPYMVKTIDKRYLVNYQGVVTKEIFERIQMAMDYHQGRIDIAPEYDHCPATKLYVPMNETHTTWELPDTLECEDEEEAQKQESAEKEVVIAVSAAKDTPHQEVTKIDEKSLSVDKVQELEVPEPIRKPIEEEVSLDQIEKEQKEEAAFEKALTGKTYISYSVSKLVAMKKEIRIRRDSMNAYLSIDHMNKLTLSKCNSVRKVQDFCNISYYTAAKILDLIKIDAEIDRKEFLKFTREDKHKLQYLNKSQQETFMFITNYEILNFAKGNKFSENYLNTIRTRYIKELGITNIPSDSIEK